MANKFEVQVVALDRFTKTFRDLNNKASKAARPLVNVQRQVGALAKEVHLDKVAKGMGKVSDAAVTMSRTLGLSLGPLESVLGIGAAGGVVGGLLAAGSAAVALGVRFGNSGFEINRTSQRIGMSARDLQRWRGAARLAGIPLEALDSTVTSLGTTLQDAKFGRDPVALQALNRLGISIKTKNGLVDQNAALEDISDALSKINDPHVRDLLANVLHIDPQTLPLLMQSAAAVHKLQDEAQKLGMVAGPEALKWADDFGNSLNRLKGSAEGIANTLGAKVVPSLTNAMNATSNFLASSTKNPLGTINAAASRAMHVSNTPGFGISSIAHWMATGKWGGVQPTTPEQRSVRGTIGGPVWSSAGTPPAPAGVKRSAAEDQMASQVGFTPAELARQQADETSESNRRELMREIQRTTNPDQRAILEGALGEINRQLQVEVAFKNAPAGTTATTRSKTDNAYVPTRVSYAMPTGDTP